jgi:hypothetical protein
MSAICGAVPQNMMNASCGASPQLLRIPPGNGACGGVGAPPPQNTLRSPNAVIAVNITGGAAGDERVVAMLRPRFRACANHALAINPTEQGKLVVTATVSASGDVTNATITTNGGLSEASAQCMLRGVKVAQFPAGAARTVTVAIAQTKQSP